MAFYNIPHLLLNQFICWWTFILPLVLAIVNTTAMNIGVHVSFQITVFFRYMPRSGVAGPSSCSILSFLKNLFKDWGVAENQNYLEDCSLKLWYKIQNWGSPLVWSCFSGYSWGCVYMCECIRCARVLQRNRTNRMK